MSRSEQSDSCSPAEASSSTSGAAAQCKFPKASDDDTISVLGRICDRRDTPQTPVAGVAITVEDGEGNVVGEATTGDDGTFEIPLPGTAVENLGKKYVVILDEESLPEGSSLADEGSTEREIQINLDNDFTVAFPVGELEKAHRQGDPGASAAGRRHRVLGAAGDVGARPVDDLRHHRAHQLRPR